MSLTTRVPGHIVIADEPANIVFSTCMIGDLFGEVESADVQRAGDIEQIKKSGNNLLAAIIADPRFELKLNTLYTADVTPPELGQTIVFPLAGIKGRIMPPIGIKWTQGGQRMLEITATSWDSLSENEGAGYAYSIDAAGAFGSVIS